MYWFGGRPPDKSAFRADTSPGFRRFIPFGRPVAVVLACDEYAEISRHPYRMAGRSERSESHEFPAAEGGVRRRRSRSQSRYLTLLRRRWTRNPSTITKRTPATILMSSVSLCMSSSFQYLVEKVLKCVRHNNRCRTQGDKKQAREDEQHQRENEFDGRLRRHFLHLLNALRPQDVGVSAQSLGHAGAILLRLNQGGNKASHGGDVAALGQVLPGIAARAACAQFQHHNVHFIAKRRMCGKEFHCGP